MAENESPAAADAPQRGTFRVKRGLAEMLKGGVIMDVVTPEQARVAEDAGAVAVMALERVPADIRVDGGVARMSDPEMIEGIKAAVTIPVMAKARIGHFVEAQILLPLEAAAKTHTDILAACRAAGATSWLCAAKLFSPDDYPLSFSGEGISLSICIPGCRARQADFPAFYDRMAGMAQDAGGKVNLTKDEFMSPARVRAMYPALGAFLAFKERVDPDGLFQSGFYRRLRD